MARTGWFNRNKTGYSVKHESHRHSLAAKGIKTALPKGVKNVSFSGSPTPNFDMVKKGKTTILLTEKKEEPKFSDWGKYDIPPDKIRVKDEPYESFYTVFNKEDVKTFKKIYNQLAKEILGVKFLLASRRYYQNGVFYDIYHHRWVCIDLKTNKEMNYDSIDNAKWKVFKKKVNSLLGKVHIV